MCVRACVRACVGACVCHERFMQVTIVSHKPSLTMVPDIQTSLLRVMPRETAVIHHCHMHGLLSQLGPV